MAPAARKAQLLDCALELFSEKGIDVPGHSELAQRAGVAIPTTFHYYPTSEDLTSAVIAEVTRFLIEDFVESRIDDLDEPGAQAIATMLMAFTDAIDKNPYHIRIWLQWSANVEDTFWHSYKTFYQTVLRRIKVLILRGVRDGSIHPNIDADSASRVILSSAHMVAHIKFSGEPRTRAQRAVDSLINGYLNGYR